MTQVREGTWARIDGDLVRVRHLRDDRWRRVVDGRLVPPEHTADELEGLISVENHGFVGGHEFLVRSAPGDDLDIYAITVPVEVREALGLEGNPYDGWWARVPAAAVRGLREQVRPRSSWPGQSR